MEPEGLTPFNLFDPWIFTCPDGSTPVRYGGDGDGGKILCLGPELQQPGCIIYSIGSNGDYAFEQEMLKARGRTAHAVLSALRR